LNSVEGPFPSSDGDQHHTPAADHDDPTRSSGYHPDRRRGRRRRRDRRPPPADIVAADEIEDGHARVIDPRAAGAEIYTDHGLTVEMIDPDAEKVLRRLRRYEFQAYLVGGCVRDLLVGHRPKDFDIATSATPRQIKRLFRNSRIIGRRFRLVHVHFGAHVLEVSTFRGEGAKPEPEADADACIDPDADPDADYGPVMEDESDGGGEPAEAEAAAPLDLLIRRDNVFGRADEDARRRDFTCNALFYDIETNEVIDFVGGMRDIRRKVIEVIGDPIKRLREDPVRMLRAIKFAGRLRFDLARDLLEAIDVVRDDLRKCAAPRLYEELQRLMNRGGAYRAFQLLQDTRLLHVFLPEIDDFLDGRGREPSFDGKSAADRFWATLRTLDKWVLAGHDVNTPVMLAGVFCHLFDHILHHTGPLPEGAAAVQYDIAIVTDEVLRGIALRLQMPRRDIYRVTQIMVALRRLTSDHGRKKRQSPSQLLRKDYFRDAFLLFQIYSQAIGRYQDDVERWAQRISTVEHQHALHHPHPPPHPHRH
jgi:poly(A) polymerase